MTFAISAILLFTVSSDMGIKFILLASFRPSNICVIFTPSGLISFSPDVWGAFAIIKETSYQARRSGWEVRQKPVAVSNPDFMLTVSLT